MTEAILEILAELFADQNGCELTRIEILKGDEDGRPYC